MLNAQTVEAVTPDEIKVRAACLKEDGYRLVQMCCTMSDGYEITYTFDKEYTLTNLRLHITPQTEVESISDIYSFAFLYENEMKDLFGVKFNNMLIDFKGNLYKTALKTPFNTEKTDTQGGK